MSHFRFAALLSLTFVTIGAAIITLGVVSDPYIGDLTRLGGYQESEFGWRQPQQRFVPSRYAVNKFEPGSDVLILGDSMTVHRPGEQTDLGVYWPNWLQARTGWKISALHRREVFVTDVLAMPEYQANPPRFLVLEFAERAITGLERLVVSGPDGERTCDPEQSTSSRSGSIAGLSFAPVAGVMPEAFSQPVGEKKPLDLSLGGHRLKHVLMRTLLPGRVQSIAFPFERTELFSSRRADTLLVFRDDLVKIGLPEDAYLRPWCGLKALQDLVEANGHTHLITLVVPDKLSTYLKHTKKVPQPYPEVIPGLAQYPGLYMPRVDLAFASALQAGAVDLFMPNDTHLGYVGHQVLADAFLKDLLTRGFVYPADNKQH